MTPCHATFNSIDSILSLHSFWFFLGGFFSSSFSSSVLCLSLEVSINVSSDFTTHSLEDFFGPSAVFQSFFSFLSLFVIMSFFFLLIVGCAIYAPGRLLL